MRGVHSRAAGTRACVPRRAVIRYSPDDFVSILWRQIAIDSAIFPQGTTGRQLDVLARRALWQEGLNYMVRRPRALFRTRSRLMRRGGFVLGAVAVAQHGTGHGVGSFLSVHEGPHSFSNDVELVPGHVITNEPGFCAWRLCSSFSDAG